MDRFERVLDPAALRGVSGESSGESSDSGAGSKTGASGAYSRRAPVGCADEILVVFKMALVAGEARITSIENAESGWSVRAGPDPVPDQVLRGFQLTQAQFQDYHRLMTGQPQDIRAIPPNVQAHEASAMLTAVVPVHPDECFGARKSKGRAASKKRRRTHGPFIPMSTLGLKPRGPRSIRVYDLFQEPVQLVSTKQQLSTTIAYLQSTAHFRRLERKNPLNATNSDADSEPEFNEDDNDGNNNYSPTDTNAAHLE